MKDLISKVKGAASIANDFVETADERQKVLDGRHVRDMTSDNWFSKSVRPLVTIFTGLVWGIITVKESFAPEMEWALYTAACAPFLTCIGWYFESRKREKIAAQNAKANITVERIKARSEVREDRKEARHERKMERRKLRSQDTEDYASEPSYKAEN